MTPLRQRMSEDMQIRNLAPHTQRSYLQQVSQLARHFGKSPELLGPDDIRAYQLYLTRDKHLSASSILSQSRPSASSTRSPSGEIGTSTTSSRPAASRRSFRSS